MGSHDSRSIELMQRALVLARRGWQFVSPNPMVGAVVVRRGRIVAEGYHRRFGGPHAEVDALRRAGKRARDADLFVTLEPCSHHGKTPPCSVAIAEAGVRRVFYASRDANPETRGRGPRFLRRQGIDVHAGLLQQEAVELNAPYFHWRATGLPWVIVKWAMTADGKMAARTGDARWISGERSRAYAHALRRRVDALICGTETYRIDDPNLLPRPARGRLPLRVVLDRRGRLPLGLQIFGSSAGERLYVTSKKTSQQRCRIVEERGLEALRIGERKNGLDLRVLLRRLGKRGVSQVLVEGGAGLLGSLCDAKLANEAVVFVAPKILGGTAAPAPVGGKGPTRVADALPIVDAKIRRLGEDVVIEGRL